MSSFSSRDDLIDTVLVSCHIPYWFDGGSGGSCTLRHGLAGDKARELQLRDGWLPRHYGIPLAQG